MRLLHTADLHLGRAFEGKDLSDDQAAILDQIAHAARSHQPDALIIAGDIYDRATPPAGGVRLCGDFIRRVFAETSPAIVIIAGNHDSGHRIDQMAMFADGQRAHVRGALAAHEPPFVLHDAHGPVAISGLPFGYEFAARATFGDPTISSPEDAMRAQVEAARAAVAPGARWIVAAHTFVAGGAASDVERPVSRTVGTIETVGAHVFDGAHYVALGHLHRPQSVGAPYVRYAGAPLAFGFDEAGHEKSMALVSLDAAGAAEVDLLPFTPLRRVRTLTGTLEALLSQDDPESANDFIRPVLTDEARPIDPLKRLQARYPNVCGITFATPRNSLSHGTETRRTLKLDRRDDVVAAFLKHVRGSGPTDAEAPLIASALRAADTATESQTESEPHKEQTELGTRDVA
ncbi:MAG: exonuclease SbcCD subunit D [Pseudomonadota bacterium]